MKKINFVILVLSAASFCSCEDFLSKEPLNDLTVEKFYETEADVTAGLIGAYNDFQYTRFIPHNFVCITSIAAGDAWEPNSNAPGLKEYEKLEVTSSNGDGKNLEIFIQAFGIIGEVNRVLLYLPEINTTEEAKNELEGEIRFLRALSYYHLVGLFGGMPILREATNFADEVDFTRATVQETWAFVIEDLTYAAANLPASRDQANQGRATRGSANGLLARILAMRAADDAGLWQRAKEAAQAVINDGYSLDPDYANNFKASGDYNSESLFEIGYDPESPDAQGNQVHPFNTAPFAGGWSYGESTSQTYKNFEADDVIRRKASVYMIGDTINDTERVWDGSDNPEFLSPSPNGFVRAGTAKYNTPNQPCCSGSGINFKLIRFAEMLLVMAEAENELGNTASALGYLKQVRDRANLNTDMTLTDQASVREMIFMERMAELTMEGVKYYDLVQRNRGRDFKIKTYNRDEFLFPIPQAEIDKNGWQQNTSLTQAMKDEFMAGVIVNIR